MANLCSPFGKPCGVSAAGSLYVLRALDGIATHSGMQHSKARSPGPGERAIAACSLAVLAAVLAGVCIRQTRFDPAVMMSAGVPPAAPAQAMPGLLEKWPAGLSPMSGAEAFSPGTLSDKIDGKADLYLSAGFVSLKDQRVALAGGAGSWMEMLVFDMGLPANAFSVYSSQRRPNAADAGIADYSYEADNELCLVHGNYYVELVCSDSSDPARRAAETVARAYVGATAVAEHANMGAEQALFPPEGLVAGSIALVPSDVFGFDRLKNVFVARYRDGGNEVTLFAANRGAPDEAAKVAAELRGFFVADCGGRETPAPPAPPGAAIFDLGGSFEAVFAAGPYIAGVHQAPDRESAQRWLAVLSRRISGAHP
jgi:hypothetical protein